MREPKHRARDRHIMAMVAELRTMMLAEKPDHERIRRMVREAKAGGISAATVAKFLMLVPGVEEWLQER